jgi:hypothetical protein
MESNSIAGRLTPTPILTEGNLLLQSIHLKHEIAALKRSEAAADAERKFVEETNSLQQALISDLQAQVKLLKQNKVSLMEEIEFLQQRIVDDNKEYNHHLGILRFEHDGLKTWNEQLVEDNKEFVETIIAIKKEKFLKQEETSGSDNSGVRNSSPFAQ